ncbi:MAG: hypothetical protein Q7R47_05780 [Candidatus Diapherotrites archaeon]|nr:hypothetical protein [Candidatus Diapherotrites archaeon]
MKCALCNGSIEKYDPAFHRLRIDEKRSVDICPACIEKFAKWQRSKLAALFPTAAAKRMYGKKN